MHRKKPLFYLLIMIFLLANHMSLADSTAASLAEFTDEVMVNTEKLETSFSVSCTDSVKEALEKESSIGHGLTVLSEILTQAGVYGPYAYSWNNNRLYISNLEYYAGWKIGHAVKNGQQELLSFREQETLKEALFLLGDVSGSTLEKERMIYDRLCGKITYVKTEDGGDKDCAVGALLNGRADCDGYADAMLLCCKLADIPCGYVHGFSKKPDIDGVDDGLHLWNRVCLDGIWLMCDVTWGDHGTKPEYLFFNLGTQDALSSYDWDRNLLFSPMADSADFSQHLMPDQQPFWAESMEDVYNAAKHASCNGTDRFTIFFPNQLLWEKDFSMFTKMIHAGAVESYNYDYTGRLFEISSACFPVEDFGFCWSEDDIIFRTLYWAQNDTRNFRLYFVPEYAQTLFQNEHAALQKILAATRLTEPGTYQYSEEAGYVAFSNASWLEDLPVGYTIGDITHKIRQQLLSRPDSVIILIVDGLYHSDVLEEVKQAVFASGVKSFAYSFIGNRLCLLDLVYE